MTKVSFADEIAKLESALEEHRRAIEELEQRRSGHDVQTREVRAALEGLRAALGMETATGGKGRRARRSVGGALEPLDVNPDSGRPSRGARREQVETICRRLGARGARFRTAEVLQALREVEGDLTAGMRSYTYAVMNTLEEEGLVTKVDRGTWMLARYGTQAE